MSEFRRKLMMAYVANLGRGNIIYPGLIAAWSAAGKTNDDEDRAVLKDLTGNGHDITLNGFAFSEMSGYGGYTTDFTKWTINSVGYAIKLDYKTFKIIKPNGPSALIFTNLNVGEKLKIKITGLTNSGFTFTHNGGNATSLTATEDGIYEIEQLISTMGFKLDGDSETANVIIEQIPEYPDALVFDGVDDYGINEDMPILTDYTIVVDRKWIANTPSDSYICGKSLTTYDDGAFLFENNPLDNTCQTVTFGKSHNIEVIDTDISYQTSNSYNGKYIQRGNFKDTSNIFTIGGSRKTSVKSNIVFYSSYLFDRSLDEQEIKAFIRKYIDPEYLLPSEIPDGGIPIPDCYYDFTNGDNTASDVSTIKDLSGNGNNAVAHGFDWNEEGSGYKDGALYFDGVDDYISLDAFDSGFKSVFILCKPLKLEKYLYDQRYLTTNFFSITNNSGSIAYNINTTGGVYINGIFNNTLTGENLLNKKHLITANKIDAIIGNRVPIIGNNNLVSSNSTANMALYKFLGFKDALTEEQINAVINKYNLLDGVDEIEVS